MEGKVFNISGSFFSTVPKYYDWDASGRFCYYDKVDEKKFTGMRFASLDEAEKWLFETHPSYYFGCSIHEDSPAGDFLCNAVPQAYEHDWQTTDRTEILKQIAKIKGFEFHPERLAGVEEPGREDQENMER